MDGPFFKRKIRSLNKPAYPHYIQFFYFENKQYLQIAPLSYTMFDFHINLQNLSHFLDISFTTSPAKMSPATDGTNAIDPGVALRLRFSSLTNVSSSIGSKGISFE